VEQFLADFDHLGIFRFAMLQSLLIYSKLAEIENAVLLCLQIISALEGIEPVYQQSWRFLSHHFSSVPVSSISNSSRYFFTFRS